jgi:hypothetical protein
VPLASAPKLKPADRGPLLVARLKPPLENAPADEAAEPGASAQTAPPVQWPDTTPLKAGPLRREPQ